MKRILSLRSLALFAGAVSLLSGCDSSSSSEGGSPTAPQNKLDSLVFVGTPTIADQDMLLSLIGETESGKSLQLSAGQVSIVIDSVSSGAKTGITITNILNTSATSGLPLAAQLIMDGSGSMSSNDEDGFRKIAGKSFVNFLNANSASSKVAIAEFSPGDGEAYFFNLWADFTPVSTPSKINPFFDSLSESGSTPLFTSIRRGLEHTDSVISQATYQRVVIAFTDGGDNDSYERDSVGALIALSQTKKIPVSAVGMGSSIDAADLFRLAWSTGGIYGKADSASELVPLFSAISQGAVQGATNIQAKLDKSAYSCQIYWITVTVTVNGVVEHRQFKITAM